MLELQTEGRQQASDTTAPAASIVTVNTNEKHRLEVYLPSIFLSRGVFEVIISDNGSTDGSLDFIENAFSQTRVLLNGRNVGFAAANNRAARMSRNQILVFLNPDTSVQPDWLYYLLLPFRDPRVGLTTPKILLMNDPDKINTCGNEIHLTGLTMCRGMGQPRDLYDKSDVVDAVSGAAFAIRRGLFEKLGGFDEDFFIYMEETDLSVRARLNGWKCVYVPESIVFHDYRLRFGTNKVLYQERNRYALLLKSLKWKTLIVILPALVLAEVLTWSFVGLRDRPNWRNKLRAYRSIIATRKQIMRKRRATQQLRVISDRALTTTFGFRLDFEQVERKWVSRLAQSMFAPPFLFFKMLLRLFVWW